MKLTFKILLVFSLLSPMSKAQLNNGDTAPNFELFDLDGNWHHLYGYLDEGKAVFIKFFACHCPSCWAYHNTGTLESLYNYYGPDGTDQVMVLMLEHDLNTTMDHFLGNHWYTQGDWITGNPVPVIDVQDADRGVFTDYGIQWYPRIIKVCPDKTVEWMTTSMSANDLFQSADACAGELSTEDVKPLENVMVTIHDSKLIVSNADNSAEVTLLNSLGQNVEITKIEGTQTYTVSTLESGLYFVRVTRNNETIVKKIHIQ